MRHIVFSITPITLTGSFAAAATMEDEIRKAEERWATAVTAVNVAVLDQILGDQLIYAHAKPLDWAFTASGQWLSVGN